MLDLLVGLAIISDTVSLNKQEVKVRNNIVANFGVLILVTILHMQV